MKQKLSRLLVTLLVVLTVMSTIPAFAAEVEVTKAPVTPIVATQDGTAVIMSEETTYVFRIYNGWVQRRLWSYTYGIWLTDWENMAPA